LTGQSREILANIIYFMRREASENKPIKDIQKVQERVAIATGVSVHTISNIEKEMRQIENVESSSFSTPNKKEKYQNPKQVWTIVIKVF
jgi:DNA-binding XRE family transcriptional regulator